MKKLFMLICVAAISVACGGTKNIQPAGMENEQTGEFAGAPKWVTTGCSNLEDLKGSFCGVGSSAVGDDISMARDIAQGRGRTEIAKNLQTDVASMLKDYRARQRKEGKGQTVEDVESVSKLVTDTTVAGAVLKDTWISKNNNLYALMVMDVEAFKSGLDKIKDLSAEVKEVIRKQANRAHKELDAAVEKKNAK